MPFGVARTNFRTRKVSISFDADALLWKAAVVVAGGTVSDGRLSLVSDLIRRLKAGSLWTPLDRLWLWAAENSFSALIDLKNLVVATATNSPTFTANRGYTGDAATSYVNTNYNPTLHAVALSQNSGHLSVYTTDANDTLAVSGYSGASVNNLSVFGPYSDGVMYGRIHQIDGSGFGSSLSSGMFIGDRINGTTVLNYYRGGSVGTETRASTGIPNDVLLTCGTENTNAGLFGQNARRHGMLSVGGSLGAAGDVEFSGAINAYMTSVGASVY